MLWVGKERKYFFQFNTELRRILISLIDSSILLQSVGDDKETDNAGKS